MACRPLAGTSARPPPATRRTTPRRPRSTAHGRSPPRSVADAHAAPPVAGQATASAASLPGPRPNLVAAPCAHLQIEVLRRPVEFALRPGIGVVDQLPADDG